MGQMLPRRSLPTLPSFRFELGYATISALMHFGETLLPSSFRAITPSCIALSSAQVVLHHLS